MNSPLRVSLTSASAKWSPVVGAMVGLFGGIVYWLAVQAWPTSVAVVLAMLVVTLLMPGANLSTRFFYLLLKYNALMALSAAKLPFVAAPNTALGLNMVCGLSSSRALWVSAHSASSAATSRPTTLDVGIAMLLGFAPAALLGIPGLSGVVVAIIMSIGFVAYSKRLDLLQPMAEVSFYLGALATWSYT